MVPADSHRISRVPRYSGAASRKKQVVGYWTITFCGPYFHRVLLTRLCRFVGGPTTPDIALLQLRFGLIRVRSPLLAESLLFSFPPGNEMFQFPGFAPRLAW